MNAWDMSFPKMALKIPYLFSSKVMSILNFRQFYFFDGTGDRVSVN